MFRFSLQEGATHPPIDNVSKIVGIFGVIVRDTEGVDCPLDSSSVCIAQTVAVAFGQSVGFPHDAVLCVHAGLPVHHDPVKQMPAIVASSDDMRHACKLIALACQADSFELLRVGLLSFR